MGFVRTFLVGLVVALVFGSGVSADARNRPTVGKITVGPAGLPRTLPPGWQVRRAQTIATRKWWNPCGGQVRVEWSDFKYDPRTVVDGYPYSDAWAAAPTMTAEARATGAECFVLLNSRKQRWTWGRLCTVVLHEFGHLAGREHSDDPLSMMYPEQHPDLHDDGNAEIVRLSGGWVQVPGYNWRCRGGGVRYLRSHGLL